MEKPTNDTHNITSDWTPRALEELLNISGLPMYHRDGEVKKMFQKNINNIIALCAILDNPQNKFKSIHVGGTNGKGSTSHLLAAVFQAKGLKVGLTISPHYKDPRERIKINGQFIPIHYFVDFVAKNKTRFAAIQPSFFEMMLAMAFQYFADEQVDLVIVEVGMGGRFDSTNLITPLLSIITNISFDHQSLLGNTLSEIAHTKAGIIKPNAPVVIGEYDEVSALVFEATAREQNAPIVFANQRYEAIKVNDNKDNNAKNEESISKTIAFDCTNYDIYRNKKKIIEGITLNLKGDYQAKNIATVLQTIEVYNDLQNVEQVTEKELREGFRHVKAMTTLFGRWDILSQKPYTVADSAHNVAGISLVLKQAAAYPYTRLRIITGGGLDKDMTDLLKLYPTDAVYYFAKGNVPRALPAEILRDHAATFGLQGEAYSSVQEALNTAQSEASDTDLILILGRIFLVAEIL